MKPPESDAAKILATLNGSDQPLTIYEICRAIWGRAGERERNLVMVNIHRLDKKGLIEKFAARYGMKNRTS